MSGEQVGYVVVMFNQASGQPDVAEYSFNTDRADVEFSAEAERIETRGSGRRDTYAVAEITLLEDPS